MLSLLFCTLPLFDAELRFTALQKPQDSNTFAMHGYAALCSIWRWLPWDFHAQEYKIPGRIMGVNGNDAGDNILHRKQVK